MGSAGAGVDDEGDGESLQSAASSGEDSRWTSVLGWARFQDAAAAAPVCVFILCVCHPVSEECSVCVEKEHIM